MLLRIVGYLKNLEDKLHKGVIDQRTYEAMKTNYEGSSESVQKNLDAPYSRNNTQPIVSNLNYSAMNTKHPKIDKESSKINTCEKEVPLTVFSREWFEKKLFVQNIDDAKAFVIAFGAQFAYVAVVGAIAENGIIRVGIAPAVISFIIYMLVKKSSFAKIFAVSSVIMLLIAIIGKLG